MFGVVVGGLGLLVGLAMVIGVAIDREARDAGWNRLAVARRIARERLQEIEQSELVQTVRASELDARERSLDARELGLVQREVRGRGAGA